MGAWNVRDCPSSKTITGLRPAALSGLNFVFKPFAYGEKYCRTFTTPPRWNLRFEMANPRCDAAEAFPGPCTFTLPLILHGVVLAEFTDLKANPDNNRQQGMYASQTP
jgi:hypothetical protein